MITRRVLLGSATGLLLPLTPTVAAQNATTGNKVVFQHDLPDVALKGWAATVVEVN